MEGERSEREKDCRVPVISALFGLCLTAGGILLGIYVFAYEYSKSWFPAVALTLIAMPWIFWVVMYFYTCIKACVRRCVQTPVDDHRQISRRSYQSKNTMGRISSVKEPSASNDGKHVQFGAAVVMPESEISNVGGQDSSVSSS